MRPARRPFTEHEINLMKDVTLRSKDLAALFDVSEQYVGQYRRDKLGIFIGGRHMKYSDIRNKIDWSLPDVEIACALNVGPPRVKEWRSQHAADKRTAPVSAQMVHAALQFAERAADLAPKLGVASDKIRYIRRKHGVTDKPGPRTYVPGDFGAVNWRQPVNALAKQLGVCWKVADRLKAAALSNDGPNAKQMRLPGFEGMQTIPEDFPGVDWTENASVLCCNLGLDRSAVLRLKSMAARQRRTA